MQFCTGRRHCIFSLIYGIKEPNMNIRPIHCNAPAPFLLLFAPSNSLYAGGVRLWESAILVVLRGIALTQVFYAVVKRVAIDVVYGVSRSSVVVSPHKSVRSVQDVVYANLMVVVRNCTCKGPSNTPAFSLFPIQMSIRISKQGLQSFFGKVAISSVHKGSNYVQALYNTGTRPFA